MWLTKTEDRSQWQESGMPTKWNRKRRTKNVSNHMKKTTSKIYAARSSAVWPFGILAKWKGNIRTDGAQKHMCMCKTEAMVKKNRANVLQCAVLHDECLCGYMCARLPPWQMHISIPFFRFISFYLFSRSLLCLSIKCTWFVNVLDVIVFIVIVRFYSVFIRSRALLSIASKRCTLMYLFRCVCVYTILQQARTV